MDNLKMWLNVFSIPVLIIIAMICQLDKTVIVFVSLEIFVLMCGVIYLTYLNIISNKLSNNDIYNSIEHTKNNKRFITLPMIAVFCVALYFNYKFVIIYTFFGLTFRFIYNYLTYKILTKERDIRIAEN